MPPSDTVDEDTPRVSTGNPELDDILGGGFDGQRMYLYEGRPGTGKTTLALEFLLEGVRHVGLTGNAYPPPWDKIRKRMVLHDRIELSTSPFEPLRLSPPRCRVRGLDCPFTIGRSL